MALNTDLQALRDYVVGPSDFQNQSASTVRLMVTHSNLKARFLEIRLDMHMAISAVKDKLCSHCGTNPSAMMLQLKDQRGTLIASMNDPSSKLGFYSPHDGYIIHVIDTDPTSISANGWLEDVSKVQKYEMSDEDYNKRENTYRKYKEEKLKQDPKWTLEKEIAARKGVPYTKNDSTSHPSTAPTDDSYLSQEASTISVGSRCEIVSSEGSKRGVVKYVGKVEKLRPGWWVGVAYDEPVGKNDGSVHGVRYFECAQGYGGFVRPNVVNTGDYPPFDDDFNFSDDDEI